MPTEVSYIWRKNTPHRRVASVAMQQACNMNSFDKRPSICSSSHSMVDARSKVAARRIPRCRPTPRPRNRAKWGPFVSVRKLSEALQSRSKALHFARSQALLATDQTLTKTAMLRDFAVNKGFLRISSRKATRRVPLNRLHNSIECAEDWRSQRLVISDGRAWAAAARK
jgi:hypothetical protein